MKQEQILQFVRENAFEADISYRGGNLKVDATELFPSLGRRAVVGAYQNYLGGGIAGAIVGAAMFDPSELTPFTPEGEVAERDIFPAVLEACKVYFHELNNGGGDEYMQENYGGYEFNQGLPVSAY